MVLPPDAPAAEVRTQVVGWYERTGRDLPWRAADRTPWGVFVSEVMLQQTPVARVLPAWQTWLARWPTPAGLAAEAAGEAVREWGRLGYPRRALRLHQSARVMVAEHGGAVPADLTALRALPGVGAYTAAAVYAFAFGGRVAVVDTNVRRVLGRVFAGVDPGTAQLSAAERVLAEHLLPPRAELSVAWNTAAMELGALVCTARAPRCGQCPVRRHCSWHQAGSPASGSVRRSQPWAGTDRQLRGQLMAAAREACEPVWPTDLAGAAVTSTDRQRRDRCLAGLVADGLLERLPDGRYRLPGVSAPG